MRTQTRSRDRSTRRAVLALVVTTVAGWLVSPAGTGATPGMFDVYKTEAETLGLPTGGSTYADGTASGSRAVLLTTNGTAARWAWVTSATRVTVRARGQLCGGPPRLTVKLGPQVLLATDVPQTTWTDLVADAAIAGGWYPLSVQFSNDYKASTCDRALRIDRITLSSPTAINNGTAGSQCQGNDGGLQTPPLPAGYSTTSLGAAPGYYETAPPSGAFAALPPLGIMILIHGGGWSVAGPAAAAAMRSRADEWRARGWSVASISSGKSCGEWLNDVLWFYDKLRSNSPTTPICALGASSGGHLALMLTVLRPDVHCAIDEGGPTDLVSLAEQTAYDAATGASTQQVGPEWIRQQAIAAFGSSRMAELSPALRANEIRGRVTVGIAARDMFVPTAQSSELMGVLDPILPFVHHTSLVLETGTIRWVHANVSVAALDALRLLQIATAVVT